MVPWQVGEAAGVTVKNVKAPFFPHLLSGGSFLHDCRNSSSRTIANALKLVF